MQIKSLGACTICGNPVAEMSAYAKLASVKYAHLSCFNHVVLEQGRRRGRQEVLDEQAAARALEEKAHQEKAAYERAEAERRLEIQERERTNRIQAAKNNPLPPKVEPRKEEPKDDQEKPDRFKLIDIE